MARNSKCIWMVTTRPPCLRVKDLVRVRRSSTSPTTATCQRCAMASGRCFSPRRNQRGWMYGASPCLQHACQYLSIFMQIRLKQRYRVVTVTNMTNGPLSGCLCLSPPKLSSLNFLQPLRISHQG